MQKTIFTIDVRLYVCGNNLKIQDSYDRSLTSSHSSLRDTISISFWSLLYSFLREAYLLPGVDSVFGFPNTCSALIQYLVWLYKNWIK